MRQLSASTIKGAMGKILCFIPEKPWLCAPVDGVLPPSLQILPGACGLGDAWIRGGQSPCAYHDQLGDVNSFLLAKMENVLKMTVVQGCVRSSRFKI